MICTREELEELERKAKELQQQLDVEQKAT
jgi:hypothetical protein